MSIDLDLFGVIKSLGQAWLVIAKLEAKVAEQDAEIEALKKGSKKKVKTDLDEISGG